MRPDLRLAALPRQATWQHRGARDAFEVLFTSDTADGQVLRGVTTGVEDGAAWSFTYDIDVDRHWRTRSARLRSRRRDDDVELLVERDEQHRWSIDGVHEPSLDGCVDVDLEASVATNSLSLHRLQGGLSDDVAVSAAFVRLDLSVIRLEQTYRLLASTDDGHQMAYSAPMFDVDNTLSVDAAGLVTDYPGLAVRRT